MSFHMRWFGLLVLAVASIGWLSGCTQTAKDGKGGDHADHKKDGDPKKDPHAGHDKEGQATLMVQSEPKSAEATKPAVLKLMIHDAKGAVVRDFDILHEQKVHLIMVRAGLDNFVHLHPEVDGSGNITAKHTFPAGGTYYLFADHQPKGQKQATVRSELKVSGETPAAPPLTPNAPGKVEGDGLTAEISIKGAKKGGEATIQFDLNDRGKPVTDLEPYMGELGHLMILSADGKEYVHTHAEKGKVDQGVVVFMAHFPNAGLFKGWGQFRYRYRTHVVPFVLKVD